LKAVKIRTDLMGKIENQLGKDFKSRTEFANQAIKKELDRITREQAISHFETWSAHYNERRMEYGKQGIDNFDEFLLQLTSNNDLTDVVKQIDELKKEQNAQREELNYFKAKYEIDEQLEQVDWDKVNAEDKKNDPKGFVRREKMFAKLDKGLKKIKEDFDKESHDQIWGDVPAGEMAKIKGDMRKKHKHDKPKRPKSLRLTKKELDDIVPRSQKSS